MQNELSRQIHERLKSLRESVERDTDALGPFPDGKAIFGRLFDAVESTLQNVGDSSADGPE